MTVLTEIDWKTPNIKDYLIALLVMAIVVFPVSLIVESTYLGILAVGVFFGSISSAVGIDAKRSKKDMLLAALFPIPFMLLALIIINISN